MQNLSQLGLAKNYNFQAKSTKKKQSKNQQANLQDIGKLKFVSEEETMTEKEVSNVVSEIAMPFENVFVSEGKECFKVNGLGSLVVKSCLGGKVTKVEDKGLSKTVTISHGKYRGFLGMIRRNLKRSI